MFSEPELYHAMEFLTKPNEMVSCNPYLLKKILASEPEVSDNDEYITESEDDLPKHNVGKDILRKDDLGNSFLCKTAVLPVSLQEKLKNLNVVVDWKVPSFQTSIKMKGYNKIHLTVTQRDKNRILSNWESFKVKYDLDTDFSLILTSGFVGTIQKRNILQYLGHSTNLVLCKVRDCAENLLSLPLKKEGKYLTFLETEIMHSFMSSPLRSRYKLVDLAFIIHRPPNRLRSIYKYRLSHRRVSFDRISPEFTTFLVKALAIQLQTLNEPDWAWILKKCPIPNPPSIGLLRLFWEFQLSTQVAQTEPLFLNHILIKLIRVLHGKNYEHWSDIQWKKIAKQEFPKISPYLLCHQFMVYVVSHVPKLHYLTFGQTMEILYCHFIDELMESPGKVLPNIPTLQQDSVVFDQWLKHIASKKRKFSEI